MTEISHSNDLYEVNEKKCGALGCSFLRLPGHWPGWIFNMVKTRKGLRGFIVKKLQHFSKPVYK